MLRIRRKQMDSMNRGSCAGKTNQQSSEKIIDIIKRANLPRVHNQVVFLRKALTTFLAYIRSFAGVELAVRDQVSLKRKCASTLLADEWSLPAMDPRMGQQMVLEGEALLALLALIRSLRGVKQQVSVETVLVREALAAMGADVGAFTCGANGMIRPAQMFRVFCQEQEQPPVCTRAWVVKWCLSRKDLPHSSQLYGRSFLMVASV